ncbi:ankyrin repeat and kinase domain-containing 1-like [Brachionus plicatilis]|uniref:Ankyrin repeat and kinase domain-containing 1-like n=1 Tax=Brachionus plicatilis TaxID=10195 RepID=A0A3M7QWN6_BRAPC|nr:ankyrin repeat and kinase domain-containing 1-like [Brachionus plicatilis]
MDNLKKNIIRHNRSRGDIRISSSSSYLLLNQDKKNESYKNEIQQFIKDIEDSSKYDCEAWSKYQSTELGDDLKLKIREYVLSHNGFSLLHLAAKNCRKNFCQFLIKDAKIDKDVTCKIKSTPLHTLIKTNVFIKKDYLNHDDQILKKKICEFKETFDIFIKNNADVNYQDENGNSCLHYAVAKANFVAVSLLINVSGISLNISKIY